MRSQYSHGCGPSPARRSAMWSPERKGSGGGSGSPGKSVRWADLQVRVQVQVQAQASEVRGDVVDREVESVGAVCGTDLIELDIACATEKVD